MTLYGILCTEDSIGAEMKFLEVLTYLTPDRIGMRRVLKNTQELNKIGRSRCKLRGIQINNEVDSSSRLLFIMNTIPMTGLAVC